MLKVSLRRAMGDERFGPSCGGHRRSSVARLSVSESQMALALPTSLGAMALS